MSFSAQTVCDINEPRNFDTATTTDSSTASTSFSKKTSPIWNYNKPVVPPATYNTTRNGREAWVCELCSQMKPPRVTAYVASQSTNNIKNHLKKSHKIDLFEPERQKKQELDTLVKRAQYFAGHSNKRLRANTAGQDGTFDPKVFRELYAQYVFMDDLSMQHCKSAAFRSLLHYISPLANDALPTSHSTIAADIESAYNIRKAVVIASMHSALSTIHISPDGWTAPNGLGLLGVTCRFMASDNTQQQLVLGLSEIQGGHTGDNLAISLKATLDNYCITNCLGYVTADGASNNTVMVSQLAGKLAIDGIHWDPNLHRLHCNGHIINLVVLAFLFGKDPTQLNDRNQPTDDAKAEAAEWRKRGPLGKLHNIIKHVYGSVQRQQIYLQLIENEKHLGLRRDNETRWNSWFLCIIWACKQKNSICSYCFQMKIQDDFLQPDDWTALEEIHKFLMPFWEATLATEGYGHAVNRVIPSMDYLSKHLVEGSRNNWQSPRLAIGLRAAQDKLKKYYKLTELTPIYAASVILDPRWKVAYFDTHWADRRDEATKALTEVKRLWTLAYSPSAAGNLIDDWETPSDPPSSTTSSFADFLAGDEIPVQRRDEYEEYLQERRVSREELTDFRRPTTYWLEPAQRRRWPYLSKMAIDILTVPAMSADTERLFSSAKLTLTQNRNRLSTRTVEMLLCLKSWNKSKLICAPTVVSSYRAGL